MRIRRRAQRIGDARSATGAPMLAIPVARGAEDFLSARRLARILVREDRSPSTRWSIANIEAELSLQHELADAGRRRSSVSATRSGSSARPPTLLERRATMTKSAVVDRGSNGLGGASALSKTRAAEG
jgi:hypothetical protein